LGPVGADGAPSDPKPPARPGVPAPPLQRFIDRAGTAVPASAPHRSTLQGQWAIRLGGRISANLSKPARLGLRLLASSATERAYSANL